MTSRSATSTFGTKIPRKRPWPSTGKKEVRKNQRFEDVALSRMAMFDMTSFNVESEYEFRTVARVANMGTDLVALLGAIDEWQEDEYGATHKKH